MRREVATLLKILNYAICSSRNRKWNAELKELLKAKRITPEVYEQFYQVTGLENK